MWVKKRRFIFPLIGFSFVLIVLGLVINVYFPFRPSPEEVVSYVQKQEGRAVPAPGLDIYVRDVKVIQVISEVPGAQLVVGSYLQVDSAGAYPTTFCPFADYVTRHWFTGPRTYSRAGVGGCRLLQQGSGRPILMHGHRERGTYVVIGAPNDERIESIEAHWLDGSATTSPIIEDIFFFFRSDGVAVAWVVGLDSENRVLSDTITANHELGFSPLNYVAVRQIRTGNDVFVIGAYSFTTPAPQECVEVTYLTSENARKFLEGSQYFIGQRGCIRNPSENNGIGPSVSTVVEGDMVISGRPLNPAITAVLIHWSDGFVQQVPVEDGFYFTRRPSSSATVESISGLDSNGNILAPK